MIQTSLIAFLLLCIWRSLVLAQQHDDEGLALAQLSRGRSGPSGQDGSIRISRVERPEDLTFEAPSLTEADLDVLGNLELSDTVLLASIDGRFHAVNRTTGSAIWSMEDDSNSNPSQTLLHNLVRTDHNPSSDTPIDSDDQELYVIEPQSGDIFILSPDGSDSQEPLRRLPYSVPQLVEHSPFVIDEPNRVFVGMKETSIIEVDLDQGIIKSVMSGTKSWHNDGEINDDDGYQRRSDRRIVQIGRTDYTIKVFYHSTLLQTLSFSTYGPNNVNKPLQNVWKRTPDDVYLQPSWDHTTYAFSSLGESALWIKRFKHPVVAVFDVVLQDSGNGTSAKPLVLLQPRPKLHELFPTRAAQIDMTRDKTFVNQIGNSLWAMGHLNYPLVNIATVSPSPPRLIGSASNGGHGCVGVECFLGARYTEREGANSRISRLIEAGPAHSNDGPHLVARDGDEAALDNPEPTSLEIAAIPSPSRSGTLGPDGSYIGLQSQQDNTRPKAAGTPFWTLALPFAGGFVAIWLLLRKFMKTTPTTSTRHNHLIQPLQASGSSTDVTTALLAPRSHSRHPSASGGTYATYAGATTYTVPDTESPSPRDDSNNTNEKRNSLSMKNAEEANLSLALEEARVGAGLGLPVDVKDADDSDGEDADAQDGKKKTRRGGRGKKKKNKQKNPAPTSQDGTGPSATSGQNSGQDSGSHSSEYVMVDSQPRADTSSAKMELPLPVTSSSSSLVVTSKVLGYGSHGTIVYEGALQGRAVAVKRLLQDFVTLASHEVSLLLQADDHPNVIRYFFSMTRDSFLYIALELCPCSLADLIETPNKHPAINASFEPKRALQQITQGLRHLHNLKLVHRDIKPQNILVSRPNRDGHHRMLISDFGLCKKLEVDQTSFLPTSAGGQSLFAAGTPGWRAPEILRGDVSLDEEAVANAGSGSGSGSNSGSNNGKVARLTKSVDIFALGCLFYYTLVNGEHPFGEKYTREVNILKGNMNLEGLDRFGEEGVEACNLIEWMLEQEPKSRPDTEAILVHPFFWTPARRLTFLQDASDRFEIMEREPRDAGLVALETGAFDVVGADWHKRLDKIFIENLGKYRKYQGNSVQDLLRALRNKKHHYQDLPDNVKRHLGPLPDGFLSYFTRRFPELFLHVHSVISELPLRHEPMFKSYFELEQ
ncbi:hypothetical protein M408DRAFT_329839 [Serendipita vermifera MAFF 305830]|uniref:non-specific serine/threonine protein kinase n=1 Tax=Serendipita vermifera MAFF 305830 TaxID=933852 RepID=A0A0C3ATM9_SERVB|nr:hypothetical protein M408DRAFT_329839 [Serendipita vermifera MAFF 305830]